MKTKTTVTHEIRVGPSDFTIITEAEDGEIKKITLREYEYQPLLVLDPLGAEKIGMALAEIARGGEPPRYTRRQAFFLKLAGLTGMNLRPLPPSRG